MTAWGRRISSSSSRQFEMQCFLFGSVVFGLVSLLLFVKLHQNNNNNHVTIKDDSPFLGSNPEIHSKSLSDAENKSVLPVIHQQHSEVKLLNETDTATRRQTTKDARAPKPNNNNNRQHNNKNNNKKKETEIVEVHVQPMIIKRTFTAKFAEKTSSVDYFACCGAGHRLSKLVDAHYLATRLKFGLRVFFGFCNKQEVFSFLFGPQPLAELEQQVGGFNASKHFNVKVANDVPGFVKLRREGPEFPCLCPKDRFEEDAIFFKSLRNRFRSKSVVDAFRQEYFVNKTVIGMHVRAGNGEVGDFNNKNRSIADESWASSMAELLLSQSKHWKDPPILFIATDTADMIDVFRRLLGERILVVDFSQRRPDPGQGVFFGESKQVMSEGEACLEGWESVFTDMMILSHADVVVAARPSSFTQSLPMTMALSTNKTNRKVIKSFCEVNPTATAMECYDSLMDWCCRGETSFSLDTIQRVDYRRMPDVEYFKSNQIKQDITERPNEARFCIPTPRNPQRVCLPYRMPDKDSVEEAGRLVEKKAKR